MARPFRVRSRLFAGRSGGAPASRAGAPGLFDGQIQTHPFRAVVFYRTRSLVSAGFEGDVQHLCLIRAKIGEELLLDPFSLNLEVMLLLAGIMNHERRLSGFEP